MKREQEEVLSLLKEIDEICRKNEITYFLSPQLTLCSVTGQDFPADPLAGQVYMTVPEMRKFQEAFEKKQPKERVLESMENNGKFPGFYLCYTNTETLCFQLNQGHNIKAPGICVTIHILRGNIRSRRTHLKLRVYEEGWRQTCYKFNIKPNLKRTACQMLVGLMSLVGREHLGKKLFKDFCRNMDFEDIDEYVVRDGRQVYYFPAEIFAKTARVELEGYSFLAPDEKIWYLQKVYGNNFEEQPAEDYKPDVSVMVSAYVSYAEYFDIVDSIDGFLKERRRQYMRDSIGRRRNRYYMWCWSYAKLCASKRNLNAFYLKKKDYIKNLYKNNDYFRLERIFAPYTKVMKRCLKEKEVFVVDDEIMELYLAMLEKTGGMELKGQIEKYQRRSSTK